MSASLGICAGNCRLLPKLNKEVASLRSGMNLLGDINGLISSSCALARISHPNSASLAPLENAFNQAYSVNTVIDAGLMTTQCLSGAMFYETGDNGEFKCKLDSKGCLTKVRSSFLAILCRMTRLCSKYCKSAAFLGSEEMKVVSLGAHASKCGTAGAGLGAVSSALGAVQNVQEIASGLQANRQAAPESSGLGAILCRLRASIFSLLCNIIDMLADGFACICCLVPTFLGASAALVLGLLGFLSSACNFVQDASLI